MYSRLKCTENPENRTRTIDRRSNRRAKVEKVIPDWENSAVLAKWLGACGSCPITDDCKWNIAAGYYYVHGQGRLDDPRQGPPRQAAVTLLSPDELAALYEWQPKPQPDPKSKIATEHNQLVLTGLS